MKDQKLFKAVSFIDEELISEAADYMPESSKKADISGEAVYPTPVKVKNTRQIWKYSVTVAALIAVTGGTLFIVYNKDGITGEIKDNLTLTANKSEAQSEENFENSSEDEMPSEENSVSSTEVIDVDEEPVRVTPIKTVPIYIDPLYYNYYENSESKLSVSAFDVACTDSLPTIPTCSLGKETFKEMSTEELFKYYGLEFMLPFLNEYDKEVIDDNSPHGIYTSLDGSVYDINTFVFAQNNPPDQGAIIYKGTITVTVGKNVQFGREYVGHHSIFERLIFWYDEKSDNFFVVYNIKGDCSVMISGKPDDLILMGDFVEETFREVNEGISPASYMFSQLILNCFYVRERIDDNIYKQIDYIANEYTYSDMPDIIYSLED